MEAKKSTTDGVNEGNRIIITLTEKDFIDSIYNSLQWEQSVNIIRWEHDYVEKTYTITYETLPNGTTNE